MASATSGGSAGSRYSWHIWTAAGEGAAAFRFGLCPLAGTDAFQLTAPVSAGVSAPDLTRDGLQLVADAAAGPGAVRITAVTWVSLYRTNIRMAGRFRAGRAFLAGDAANAHSPVGGQQRGGTAPGRGWRARHQNPTARRGGRGRARRAPARRS